MFTSKNKNSSVENYFYIKKHANIPQNFPMEINNTIENIAIEAGLNSYVVKIKTYTEVSTNKIFQKKSRFFNANHHDRNIVSNLILNGLSNLSIHEKLSFTIVFSNNMFLVNMIKKIQ